MNAIWIPSRLILILALIMTNSLVNSVTLANSLLSSQFGRVSEIPHEVPGQERWFFQEQNSPTYQEFYLADCWPLLNTPVHLLRNGSTCLQLEKTASLRGTELVPMTTGPLSWVAVIYQIPGYRNSFTPAIIEEQLLGSDTQMGASEFFETLSHGQTSLSSDIQIREMTISPGVDPENCLFDWYTDILRQDPTLSGYQHLIIYLSPDLPCDWAGLAVIGPSSHQLPMWIKHHYWSILLHEFGHNFGLHHARGDFNHDFEKDENGEYVDLSDLMGFGTYRPPTLNGPHYLNLDWLPADEEKVLTHLDLQVHWIATLSTVYQDSHQATWSNPSILSLAFPGYTYYLSYRIREDLDQGMPWDYDQRVTLHYQYLDETATYFVGLFGPGDQYEGEFPFTVLATNQTHAQIQIGVDSSPTPSPYPSGTVLPTPSPDPSPPRSSGAFSLQPSWVTLILVIITLGGMLWI